MALMTLSSFRQGKDEDIMSYIWQFKLVVTRFVGTLFSNDTFKHFFTQGFTKKKTIKEILHAHPNNLIVVKNISKEVEQINKEHEWLWHKEDHNILSFIPIHARILYESSFQTYEQPSMIPTTLRAYALSLNSRPPLPSLVLTYPIENNK